MLELLAYMSIFPWGILRTGNVFCSPLHHQHLPQWCLQNRYSVKIIVVWLKEHQTTFVWRTVQKTMRQVGRKDGFNIHEVMRACSPRVQWGKHRLCCLTQLGCRLFSISKLQKEKTGSSSSWPRLSEKEWMWKILVEQGCPTFCHLWAALEEEELSWATH